MKTLRSWLTGESVIPTATVWLLNDLAECRGKQELFIHQAPRKLHKLREHAIIESAVSSNRIEGVVIDDRRVGTVVFGHGLLQDRNEEEVRGYQEALAWIHEDHRQIMLSTETVLKLHHLSCPTSWDGGCFKKKDREIIEKHADGRVSVRFSPVSAAQTPLFVEKMCADYAQLVREKNTPPLLAWAAMNLDILCIHPFRDGNGRVSRLLLLCSLYQLGFNAGRYISLEAIIERSKERYYSTLKESSLGWHEGQHNPWPYVNYLLYTLKDVYDQFEERVGQVTVDYGEKTKMVRSAVATFSGPFHIRELRQNCPGISLDMIRKVLKDMRKSGEVECIGRGKQAKWRVLGNGSG